MKYLFQGRIALVWLGLAIVTLISWQISASGSDMVQASLAVSVAVVAIAVIKARFVLHDFMEIGHASPWLRHLSEVWVVGLPLAILGALSV